MKRNPVVDGVLGALFGITLICLFLFVMWMITGHCPPLLVVAEWCGRRA